jgi:exosortase A-associated hydrolase 2
MINIQAEFYQGANGNLFRLVRTPENVKAHIIYVAPLFEQANQTRHMYTRLALEAYQFGVESIIFDHYGTGDSAGDLPDVCLNTWQLDIVEQVKALRSYSNKPIYLSCILSSALLLTDDILALIDALFLAQPDFNGKRFVQQFKRLALASNMNENNGSYGIATDTIEVSGYRMKKTLLGDLSQQSIAHLSTEHIPLYWLEWSSNKETLPLSRSNQQQSVSDNNSQVFCYFTEDSKFWQSTELELSAQFIAFQQQTLFALLNVSNFTQSTHTAESQDHVNTTEIDLAKGKD